MLIALCVLSCADRSAIRPAKPPTKAAGAPGGVWVDKEGNLRIEAELYAINYDSEQPDLRKVDELYDELYDDNIIAYMDLSSKAEFHSTPGSFSNGRFSFCIPPPADEELDTAMERFFTLPEDWFKQGADVKIGALYVCTEAYYSYFWFFSNPNVVYEDWDNVYDDGTFYVSGDTCVFIYSHGDVLISGADIMIDEWGTNIDRTASIRFTKGWNVLYSSGNYSYQDDTETSVVSSRLPDAGAKWVLGY